MHTLIRFGLTGALFLVFMLHVSGTVRFGILESIESFTYDARVRTSVIKGQDPHVVIVDIDERSMAAEGQFPWARTKLAAIVDQLFDRYQVRAVGFDILFAEPDAQDGLQVVDKLAAETLTDWPEAQAFVRDLRTRVGGDAQFAAAMRRPGRNVVLSAVFKGEADDATITGVLPPPVLSKEDLAIFPAAYATAKTYTGNLRILQEAAQYGSFFDNPTIDADGVYRRVPLLQKYGDSVYGSLALQVLRAALGGPEVVLEYDAPIGQRTPLNLERVRVADHIVPVDANVAVLVPYRGAQFSFPYVSATDVIRGVADPEVLRDKIVLVGTTAPGLKDLRTTPVGTAYAGVEVHANLISGILDGRIKHRAPYVEGIETVMLFIIGMVLTAWFPRLSPVWGTVMVLGILAASAGLGIWVWKAADFVIPVGSPFAFTLLVILLQTNYSYFVESRGKREISKLFGQYVPPELVDEMAQAPESVTMESDSREMSVLFSDIRGFTTISEGLSPKELTELMNEFLTPLTGVIHKYRGTIDKYMGDAIMAFWGAPLADPEHAKHALTAGLEMIKVLAELSESFKARGWPELRVGVGVNTGVMSVGNMGSEFRMAYTVLGDAVNLGSRLEGLTKAYGVSAICSESTKAAASDFVFRELDLVRVKGKHEPVAIFEPLGLKDDLDQDLKQELLTHRQALMAYRNQAWDQAETAFFGLQQSGRKHAIYDIYLKRIAHFKKNPPGDEWDGVFTHLTK